MRRFSRTVLAMFAAVAIVAMISQVVVAQPEQGRRGRGGGFGGPPTSVRLATIEEVQKALKLTDEQKDKIGKISDQLRDDVRKAFDGGNGFEKMQDLYKDASAKLNEVLDEGQQKRLMGISIQVNGAGATVDPAVAKELNITDDQQKKLDEVRQRNRLAMREAFQAGGGQGGGREQFEKLREEGNKKLLAVLTSEQQSQLEALKGEKVDIDMSQFRGGPGGRGFGGDRGGRSERNRDESKSEEKSSGT